MAGTEPVLPSRHCWVGWVPRGRRRCRGWHLRRLPSSSHKRALGAQWCQAWLRPTLQTLPVQSDVCRGLQGSAQSWGGAGKAPSPGRDCDLPGDVSLVPTLKGSGAPWAGGGKALRMRAQGQSAPDAAGASQAKAL